MSSGSSDLTDLTDSLNKVLKDFGSSEGDSGSTSGTKPAQ